MTRREQQQLSKALIHVRLAIKGWAFSNNVSGYLKAGERAVSNLPDDLRGEGEKLLLPLRRELS